MFLTSESCVGWIFLGYVWGFKIDNFTFVVAFQSLLSR